jgi:signal transduction histidine kinase
MASHELKTPLSPLRVYVQCLQRQLERGTVEPEELARALVRMDAQIARLALLIDDLLDISRLREGHLALRRESFDLVDLARHVVERFRAELEATDGRSQAIELEAAVGQLYGRWDAHRLDQVLTNLVSNAIKYSSPDSTVTVRLEPHGSLARFSVADEGIGIPADEFGQLFQPFHRGRNAPVMYFGGLGLGLAISKGIVERHGGRIWAESEDGRGSIFTVELPLGDESAG